MSTETDLRDTLRAAERLAPDPAPVAARVAAGIRARRRYRKAGAAAAVAVATAAAVAVPSVLLSGPDGTAPVTPATSGPASPPAQEARFDPLVVPFSVGFVPAGWHADGLLHTEPGLAARRYEGPRPEDQLTVQVWDTRISGGAADAGQMVRRRLAGDVWVSVTGSPPAAVLDQVLRSVAPGDTQRLTFPFRLGWVPDGHRVIGATSGARHWLATGSGGARRADPPLLDTALLLDRVPGDPANFTGMSVGVSTEDALWRDKGVRPNGTVLGRPSRYTEELGVAELHVFDLDGMHVLVSASGTDRATLERIVRELRLVGDPRRPADWTDRPLG
ncbi:MAG TPA: hypothetical protein VE547_11375 [Mycobacteriales bacterium]|nr:hypothetical protein [Mycobacteriales bacterium]